MGNQKRLGLELKENSTQFNGRWSSELNASRNYLDNDGVISIWINGGTAYEFKVKANTINMFEFIDVEERAEMGERIAKKVAKAIEDELKDILNEKSLAISNAISN